MLFRSSVILALAALAPFVLSARSQADISGFGTGSGFTLNSGTTAQPSISGGTAILTVATGEDATSLFYNTPQDITQFTAEFTYQASANRSGDGFTFVLQNDPRGKTALGDFGGYLGYSGSVADTITPSAAVEFNLYTPYGAGTRLGTDGVTGVFGDNGGYQATGPLDLSSGDDIAVHLAYDGSTLFESLSDATAGTSYQTSYAVALPTVLGAATAYIGFTGGQASARVTQTLTDFQFHGGAPVPEASTTVSLGFLLALGGVVIAARRKKASATQS